MEKLDSYLDAKNTITSLQKEIKSIMPDLHGFIDLGKVSISEVKEGSLDGKAIRRVIIILRSTGCKWALEEHGGCTMCGHLTGTLRGSQISVDTYCNQFDAEMAKYDFSDLPMLCLYNSGSFLNDDEIPKEARHYMLNKINSTKGIQRLIIESRPEFITEETLNEIESYCPNIDIEIGVGLEIIDEQIRDLCLNKGLKNQDFIELTSRVKNHRTKLLAYVLIKPPFISETDAILYAIETIKFAFRVGFDIISLEPVSVQDFTLTSFLYESGLYRPPWIWSVLEVVKATYNLGLVRIGGFEFFPVPKIFTYNCEHCNEELIKAIQHFNCNYNIKIFDDLSCSCMNEWKFDLQELTVPYPEKILKFIGSVDKNEILKRMKMKYDVRGPRMTDIHRILFKSCSNYNIY